MVKEVEKEQIVKTEDDVLKEIEDKEIEFVRTLFSDYNGVTKGETLTADHFKSVVEEGKGIDGSSIEGFVRTEESDMLMYPDLSTFHYVPLFDTEFGNEAFVICDICYPDKRPFEGDPRNILKRVLAKAESKDRYYLIGAENEFFYIKFNENGEIVTGDKGGYFDVITDEGYLAKKETVHYLKAIGINVEDMHHEVGFGQHEIDIRYDTALKTADDLLFFNIILKAVAEKHGFIATTMPKIIPGVAGNGRHVHENSKDGNGKNIFYDPKGIYNLSEEALCYLGGQIKYAREICAATNGNVNSYKRLVVGHEAPVYIVWARNNRSAYIRVPEAPGKATRLEFRCPDLQSNPYIVFAVMIGAGQKGIEEEIKPPDPVEEDIYLITREERDKRSIITLPENLFEALLCFRESQLMKEIFTKPVHDRFYELKMEEWRQFHDSQVTKWEIERYLHN